ncbi:hypothetical protein G8770_22820 [Aestuariicella hydrocarbonica]|uniref:Uncharacterized protein n=1 Tax=Pseudomaricurvus hydrocarbonicus TaxID=1470433 RepID=A0A9E5MQ69_9GAMM|nr:hypothetical protein [Aestuariicella hydrocarbonica]NHO68396.1 hypothetical protein [Aestuariicella hydrocarbonica]
MLVGLCRAPVFRHPTFRQFMFRHLISQQAYFPLALSIEDRDVQAGTEDKSGDTKDHKKRAKKPPSAVDRRLKGLSSQSGFLSELIRIIARLALCSVSSVTRMSVLQETFTSGIFDINRI